MGSRRILFAIVLMLFAFISSLPAAAATQTFPNTTRINIPGSDTGSPSGAPAAPYPSTINVTDLTGVITDVDVRLFEFNHTFPADVDILLVGPHGQNVILMSDVGGPSNAHDATLTFDQSAGAMGATVVTGTFSPTNNPGDEEFPSPAPPPPYGASLDVFNGTDPNGEWNLYVIDDFSNDTG
ncbi:MAG TPA: proprotein convertase P-domain-containing protein, partial [Oceanobacillus sp.]|nr:proprotein convertase P-domain-containing protein [Oceanobacillus sp.]